MSDLSNAFLIRAESEIVNGRYNNVAHRAYYACFQAAIAAHDRADILEEKAKLAPLEPAEPVPSLAAQRPRALILSALTPAGTA